jgi:hypothetical protein
MWVYVFGVHYYYQTMIQEWGEQEAREYVMR